MIFYYSASGLPLGAFPNRVFQGSHNVNDLYFVCPSAKTNIVSVLFTLPNGTVSSGHMMTLASTEDFGDVYDVNGANFSVWHYQIPSSLTVQPGVVNVQFKVNAPSGEVMTTAVSSYYVEKGIVSNTEIESSPSQDILKVLAIINTKKQDEPDIITTLSDNITLTNNEEYYFETVTKMEISTGFLRAGDSAFLSFDSGDTSSSLTFALGEPKFIGTDCEDNVFIPLANKHYEILFICTYYSSSAQKVYARVNGWEI